MDCQECRDKFSLYLDGQLTESERVLVEAEIDSCAACAREFEQLSLLVADLGAIGPAEAPSHLLDDLRSAFRAELQGAHRRQEPPRGIFARIGPWRSLAAALLLALSIFVVARKPGLLDRDASPEREVAAREDGGEQTEAGDRKRKAASLADKDFARPAEEMADGEDEVEAANTLLDGDDPKSGGEREERLLDRWGGFLDHAEGSVRKRGMDLVEPRDDTERFLGLDGRGGLAAASAEAVSPRKAEAPGAMVKGAEKKAEPEAGSAKGNISSREVVEPTAPPATAPSRSYILLGRSALDVLNKAAAERAATCQVVPIQSLGEPAEFGAGVEVQIELPEAELAGLLRTLEADKALRLRLFARRPEPVSPRGAAEKSDVPPLPTRVRLLFILPRP